MATYSKTSLLDKIFIFKPVLREYSATQLPLFQSTLPIYILVSVRAMQVRNRIITDYTLSLTMAANLHSIGFKQLNACLVKLAELGYVNYVKTGSKISITELGKASLDELEKVLRTKHYKFNRDDTGRIKVPGVKRKK